MTLKQQNSGARPFRALAITTLIAVAGPIGGALAADDPPPRERTVGPAAGTAGAVVGERPVGPATGTAGAVANRSAMDRVVDAEKAGASKSRSDAGSMSLKIGDRGTRAEVKADARASVSGEAKREGSSTLDTATAASSASAAASAIVGKPSPKKDVATPPGKKASG